jgi:hypothetical protein
MTTPNEEEQAANDRLIAVGVKWLCALNGVQKKELEGALTDAIIVAMSERMMRARMTDEDLPWEKDLFRATDFSRKLRERVCAVIRKHRWPEDDKG